MSDKRNIAEAGIFSILQYFGVKSTEVLENTPSRVLDSFEELLSGYKIDIKSEIGKNFENVYNYNDIVLVKDIDFVSICEHHLLPFIGKAHICYIPNEKIIGLSKLARVVEIFSKRLQLQERMTKEIGKTIEELLNPLGVAILIEAKHQCMSIRGVKKCNAETITAYYSGGFADQKKVDQFISLIKK